MATVEKWEHSDSAQEEEEEEEALSLCDLPVNLIKEGNESNAIKEERDEQEEEEEEEARAADHETSREDFNFGPWGGSVSTKWEMCAADDIFFQGQILPFRLSISSETGSNKLKQDNPSPCISRSESMDNNSASGFTSFSSRSSSRSSHYSSSTSSTSCSSTTTRISNPRIHNRFHTHPSPKPQIRFSTSNAGSNRNRNSSVWEFFRLGLVRTPEIELQDLKVRSSVSRNSSTSSSSNSINPSTKNISSKDISSSKIDGKNMEKQRKQSLLEKGGGLLSGCSCSVSTAVKPVPLNIIIMKSNNSSTENGNNNNNNNWDKTEKRDEKMQELKMQKRMVQKQQQQQEGKQAMSRHRTFEWLKELSHASYLDHEEEA